MFHSPYPGVVSHRLKRYSSIKAPPSTVLGLRKDLYIGGRPFRGINAEIFVRANQPTITQHEHKRPAAIIGVHNTVSDTLEMEAKLSERKLVIDLRKSGNLHLIPL